MGKSLLSKILCILICFLLLVPNNVKAYTTSNEYSASNVLNNTLELTTQYESQNNFGGGYYHSVAFDFHIFSNEAIINAHTNGNIATNVFDGNGSNFGNETGNYLNKREDNYFSKTVSNIGNIASLGNIVLGTNIKTQVTDNGNKVRIGNSNIDLCSPQANNVYKEKSTSAKYIDIDKELNKLAEISKSLSLKQTSTGVILSTPNNETRTLTVDNSIKNNYLNVKAHEISSGDSKRILDIQLPAKTTLIINVDMSGASIDSLKNLVVTLNNQSNCNNVVNTENGLLWNLYDSSSSDRLFTTTSYANVGVCDYFMGTILAPNAQIAYGALNGSVIANKTCQQGKESHRWDFTGFEEEPKKGNLTISKEVTGNDSDTSKDFTFTVKLSDNGSFNYTGSKEGIIKSGDTISLKHNESITIQDVPEKTTYSVTEVEANQEGYSTTSSGDNGTITSEDSYVKFINDKSIDIEPKKNNLTISKEVTGNDSDTSKDFTFIVNFSNNGSFNYTGSKEGIIKSGDTISLKHNESITIQDVPEKTTYSVTEVEANLDGYTTTVSNESGEITDNSIIIVKFINDKTRDIEIIDDNPNPIIPDSNIDSDPTPIIPEQEIDSNPDPIVPEQEIDSNPNPIIPEQEIDSNPDPIVPEQEIDTKPDPINPEQKIDSSAPKTNDSFNFSLILCLLISSGLSLLSFLIYFIKNAKNKVVTKR